jgi:hypothetical protein
VQAGYRLWKLEMKRGNATFRPVGGGESDQDLTKASTERGRPPFVGLLYYRF